MFIESSGTLTPGQEQIDLHLFQPLDSPVYPKFCLVHDQIALAVGFLSYQVKWTTNSHWAWTPNNLIPATLWRLNGPQPYEDGSSFMVGSMNWNSGILLPMLPITLSTTGSITEKLCVMGHTSTESSFTEMIKLSHTTNITSVF
ncbi:hypothetical protein EDD18DRAFT_1107504 [Armillaria luteobubalina]|uniref:Uncharacterized protein n=1 Tax=Armillaria luteobubalina TaxID=153913 RepID=A0AA39Q0R9_9AGAR|nr:hypothetical protein EDD18DRAFT_1107504 [Armillaria luteobubalina]